MELFVIPIARGRHELYYEPEGEHDVDDDTEPPGVLGRLRHRVSEMLRAAEQRRQGRLQPGRTGGWVGRLRERMLAWMVERIAEQRLLWQLRCETAVVAVHPADLPFAEVEALIRRTLQRDYDRHRRWLVVDAAGLVISGALMILPGPNLLAYYFAFRAWGHWWSMRGASQGLHRVEWSGRECPVLSELRDLALLDAALRTARLHDIARRLHLQDLPTFVERMTMRPA